MSLIINNLSMLPVVHLGVHKMFGYFDIHYDSKKYSIFIPSKSINSGGSGMFPLANLGGVAYQRLKCLLQCTMKTQKN